MTGPRGVDTVWTQWSMAVTDRVSRYRAAKAGHVRVWEFLATFLTGNEIVREILRGFNLKNFHVAQSLG